MMILWRSLEKLARIQMIPNIYPVRRWWKMLVLEMHLHKIGNFKLIFFANEDPQGHDADIGDAQPGVDEEMEDVHCDQDKMVKYKEQGAESFLVSHEKTYETATKLDAEESSLATQPEPFTPNSLIRCSSQKTAEHSGEIAQPVSSQAALPFIGEDDDGTPEDQAAFMMELEHFYREKTMEFKPPKFYGQPLNCLK